MLKWQCILGLFWLPSLSFGSQRIVEKIRPDGFVQYVWFPHFDQGDLSGAELARGYIKEHLKELGLSRIEDLRLGPIQHSLLGSHFHFQHTLGGVDVYGSEIVVSVDQKHIYLVYNGVYPNPPTLTEPCPPSIPQEKAYDIAWSDLEVRGDLRGVPRIQKIWWKGKQNLLPSYRIELSILDPLGSWEYIIHQETGEILSKTNLHLSKKEEDSRSSSKPILDRRDAFRRFFFKSRKLESLDQNPERRDGRALVFDPNPVVVLERDDLTDDSDPSLFEGAYEEKTLSDLSYEDGFYHLRGPWVELLDWDAPMSGVTRKTDGAWFHKRGEAGFNDAMTYYHLDMSQRRLQNLGFVGDRGVLAFPIQVDTDGFHGGDNSYYDPLSKRLSFGHGCVDDNEDADVILHEVGHALQMDIVPLWMEGDSGAIGEGFGDYWATSYRYRGPHKDFNTFQMFSWDRAGGCWPGRRTDQTHAQYDRSKNYYAHGSEEGFIHEELWSTPLVQAMVELVSLGVPKEEVDRIVVQAHFGLSRGVRMEDMALATLMTARMLYPEGPHGGSFLKAFLAQNLLPRVAGPNSQKIAQGDLFRSYQ
jgi:hypothetical protein